MAVYTHVTNNEITSLLGNYNLGAINLFEPIKSGVENSNYLLETVTGKYIFTIFEKRVDKTELPFFVDLMQFAAKNDLLAPTPIADKKGNYLQDIQNKKALIVSFLPGQELTMLEHHHIAELGEYVANLHVKSAQFKSARNNNMGLSQVLGLVKQQLDYKELPPPIKFHLQQDLDYFTNSKAPTNLPSGIIHGDLFVDNVFFENGIISGVIDWYFACNDSFLYEIAICINAWCFDAYQRFVPELTQEFLDSYQAVRELTQNEKDNLLYMCRRAALRFLATRVEDKHNDNGNNLVEHKNPLEYLIKLQFFKENKDIFTAV